MQPQQPQQPQQPLTQPLSPELSQMIERYTALRYQAYAYARDNLIAPLSNAVLARGQRLNDERSLLDLTCKNWYATKMVRETTPEFRRYVQIRDRMTVEAQCQITKINNAGYSVPENISMMLEQTDYWDTDCHLIIELAQAYLKGELGP